MIFCSMNEDAKSTDNNAEKFEVATHHGFTCDGCGVSPIMGIRYHCSVLPDFDFCAKCESTKEHAHPFLKIRKDQRASASEEEKKEESKNCGSFGGADAHPLANILKQFLCPETKKENESSAAQSEQRQWPGREKRVIVVSKPDTVEALPGKIVMMTVILQNGTKWPWNYGHTVRLMNGPDGVKFDNVLVDKIMRHDDVIQLNLAVQMPEKEGTFELTFGVYNEKNKHVGNTFDITVKTELSADQKQIVVCEKAA